MRKSILFYWSCMGIICLSLFPRLGLQAQEEAPLFLIADPRPEGVYLRWGYDDAATLRAARANGLTLTRRSSNGGGPTVLLDGAVPAPLSTWTPLRDTSEFAGAIASLLYQLPEAPTIAEAREQAEQAVGMLLFAADHDFAAAQSAALGYLDKEVQPDTEYTYTLSINNGRETYATTLLLNSSLRIPRPAPKKLRGEWIQQPDNLIGLNWLRAATDTVYTSYFVERTPANQENWQRLNAAPLMQILSTERFDSLQFFNDTTARLDTDYRYRIYGMTPFGTYGPRSEPLAMPALYRPLVTPPTIKVMTQMVDSLYRVEWVPGEGDEADVVSYRVATSDDAFTGYSYQTELLAPGTIEAFLVDPKDVQYVRVEVTDRRGTVVYSQPKIIRVFDLDPPAPPTGLTGTIDTLGNVTLRWADNPEADLAGYRVFTANRPDGYFPQLTQEEWLGNVYRHTVTMETRAEAVYYKVKAIDYTGNYSAFSELLTLMRPDLKPPTPPLIKSFRGMETRVKLETAFSSSDDVVYHLVQRQEDGRWLTVDTVRTAEKVAWVTDTTGEQGTTYPYRIAAVDDADLRSFSDPVSAGRIDNGRRAPVLDFEALLPEGMTNFVVRWGYPTGQNLRGFQLYRASENGPLIAYKFLTANSSELRFRNGKFLFFDRLATASTYTYQLMAVHRDGGKSPLTAAITVTRPN